MKNYSIWEEEIKKGGKKLDKDIDVDILIIGGGMAGISTAYFLKDSNLKVSLIDKSTIGMGVTSKTTAKINYLQGTIYQTIEKFFDKKSSNLYLKSQLEAISLIKKLLKKRK